MGARDSRVLVGRRNPITTDYVTAKDAEFSLKRYMSPADLSVLLAVILVDGSSKLIEL